jgi:translation initiation factor 1
MAKKTRGKGWQLISNRRQAEFTKRTSSEPAETQRIKIREEKRNKGKVVTVASGFQLAENELKALAKKLKANCGSGGTVHMARSPSENSTIEVQGRHCDKVKALLSKAGYQTC